MSSNKSKLTRVLCLSGPCPPTGISTMQDCLSAIVMVTWQAGNGSDYYTASMQTDSGISNMCMSDSNECSVPGLTCGHNFSVSVTASNQQCNITSSQTTSLQSGEILKGCWWASRTCNMQCDHKLSPQHENLTNTQISTFLDHHL